MAIPERAIHLPGKQPDLAIAGLCPQSDELLSDVLAGEQTQERTAHATPEDRWMAIRGQIYDFTDYLPQHPADPSVFLPWCGKQATQAYETKTEGRPHSSHADQLLSKYWIGVFREEN